MIDNSNSISEVQEQPRNEFLTIEERQISNNKLKPGVYSKLKHQVESQRGFFGILDIVENLQEFNRYKNNLSRTLENEDEIAISL